MPYSTLEEFSTFGLNGAAFEGREAEARKCLSAAQGDMHGYFRAAGIDVPLPQSSVDDNIKKYECWLAAPAFLFGRGFDPSSDPDSSVFLQYKFAKDWLKDVSARRTNPIPVVDGVTQDGDTSSEDSGYAIETEERRGWGA